MLQIATLIAVIAVPTPERLASFSLVGWVMLLVLLVVGLQSWRWLQEATTKNLPAGRAGFAVVATFFLLALGTWPWY